MFKKVVTPSNAKKIDFSTMKAGNSKNKNQSHKIKDIYDKSGTSPTRVKVITAQSHEAPPSHESSEASLRAWTPEFRGTRLLPIPELEWGVTMHRNAPSSLQISEDGLFVAISSWAGWIDVLNTQTGASVRSETSALPEEKWLSLNNTGTAFGQHSQGTKTLKFLGQNKFMAVGRLTPHKQHTDLEPHFAADYALYNTNSWLLQSQGLLNHRIWGVAGFSGNKLVTANEKGVSVYDTKNLNPKYSFQADLSPAKVYLVDPEFSPKILIQSKDERNDTGCFQLWSPRGVLLHTFPDNSSQSNKNSKALDTEVSPSQTTLIAADEAPNTVALYRLEDGQKLGRSLIGHPAQVQVARFDKRSNVAITGDAKGNIRFWNANTAEPLSDFISAHDGAIQNMVVHPNNKWIATVGKDGKIKLWDLNDGSLLQTMPLITKEPYGEYKAIGPITFSSDGTQLIAGLKSDRPSAIVQWKIAE